MGILTATRQRGRNFHGVYAQHGGEYTSGEYGNKDREMIIVLSSGATKENVAHVTQMLEERGYGAHVSEGVGNTIVGAVGVPADMSAKGDRHRAVLRRCLL